MVYDRASQHGVPEIGEVGRCHQCDPQPEPNAGIDRTVTALRRCWIETVTHIHFEEPTS